MSCGCGSGDPHEHLNEESMGKLQSLEEFIDFNASYPLNAMKPYDLEALLKVNSTKSLPLISDGDGEVLLKIQYWSDFFIVSFSH